MTAARPDSHPFSSEWDKILALLDPRIPIPAHDLDAHYKGRITKRVRFSRTWWPNYGSGAGVWTKEYGNVGYDLRSFNRAERDILESLKGLRKNCYQLVEIVERGTLLRVDAADGFGSHIATTHMGPTVYDWQHWPVRVGRDRRKYAHLFCMPGNLVRLALAGLRALDEIHAANLVHMDYRLPNVCLAARNATPLQDADGDYLKIELDWQVLKSIDFGFSIARGKTPYTLLPQLADATPAAQALIEEVENLGRQQFDRLSIAERRQLVSGPVDAVQFADVQHKQNFWTTPHCSGALDRLRRIDWREDCYQFGRQLQLLRQTSGWQAFKAAHPHAPAKLCSAIDELPEKLVALGAQILAYPARDPDAEREFAQRRRDFIRREIRQLEQTVEELPPEWLADEVLILREDIEPGQRRTAGGATLERKEPGASPAISPTGVRARRRVLDFLRTLSWKPVAVGSIAGAALFLAALPEFQEWVRSGKPEQALPPSEPPTVTPAPTPASTPASTPAPAAAPAAVTPPAPTPKELAEARAAEAATARAAALAAWRDKAAAIEQSPWWRENKGRPTADQLAWVRATQRLVDTYGELEPLIDLAALPCTGRAAPLIKKNAAECGQRLAAVLQHEQFVPEQKAALLRQIVTLLEARVYHRPSNDDEATAFAAAILPGLQKHADAIAAFAFHGSYIQGCLQPPPHGAADGLLKTLLQRWPNSPAAAEARRLDWPGRLQRGDNLCLAT